MLLFQRDFRRQAFPATRFNGRLLPTRNSECGTRKVFVPAGLRRGRRRTAKDSRPRPLRFGRDDMRRQTCAVQANGLKQKSPGQRPGIGASEQVTIFFHPLSATHTRALPWPINCLRPSAWTLRSQVANAHLPFNPQSAISLFLHRSPSGRNPPASSASPTGEADGQSALIPHPPQRRPLAFGSRLNVTTPSPRRGGSKRPTPDPRLRYPVTQSPAVKHCFFRSAKPPGRKPLTCTASKLCT